MKLKITSDGEPLGIVEVKDGKFAFSGPRPDNVKQIVQGYAERVYGQAKNDQQLSKIKPDDVLKSMLLYMQGRTAAEEI